MFSPGAVMMGAQSRLLPPSVPYRFFISAGVFHVVAWVLMVAAADQINGSLGGPGLLLAALHALTLGVLVMAAIGASFQMLPVVTGQAPRALWLCRLVSWLFVPGVAVMVFGFITVHYLAMTLGALLVIGALAVFVFLVADILTRSRGLRVMFAHTWAALASLVVLVVLGLLLVIDYEYSFLADHAGFALAHLLLGIYGFMGMLTLGYGSLLLPMFALSPAPGERPALVAFGLFLAALVLAVGGSLAGSADLLAVAASMALAATFLHVWTMVRVLRRGMRARWGLSFLFIGSGWVFMAASILAGGLAAAGLVGDEGIALFVFLALFGWLLTFMLGVLQRIVPFLSAMNVASTGHSAPLLSKMAGEGWLKVHALCHFTALAAVGSGIVAGQGGLVLAGSLSGLAGALSFLWFLVDAHLRMRRLLRGVPEETANQEVP